LHSAKVVKQKANKKLKDVTNVQTVNQSGFQRTPMVTAKQPSRRKFRKTLFLP